MTWLHEILVALERLLNALLLGYYDETLSSRAYRMGRQPRRTGWYRLHQSIDRLFWWQNGHCQNSHFDETRRSKIPPGLR